MRTCDLGIRKMAVGMLVAVASTASALAQTAWPDRPVKVIVPFPPGGATDMVARVITQRVSQELGYQLVVDNRPGAGGTIGSAEVAKALPDGYTLLFTTSSTHAIAPHLVAKMPYDARKDFTPVAHVADTPSVLLVPASLPVKSVGELIAYAKANPGKLNYASSGVGTVTHMSAAIFNALAGVEMIHVPYKGTALAMPDLVAGQVHVMFDSMPTDMPHVKSGRLRALGVTSDKRSTLAPDMLTIAESGVPGYTAVSWFGVLLPAGAPPGLVDRLNKAFGKAILAPEVAQGLAKLGVEPVQPSSAAAFVSLMAADSERWGAVIRKNKITLD